MQIRKQFKNIALTTLSLLSIGLDTQVAQASTLVMGKDSAMDYPSKFKTSDYNLDPNLASLFANPEKLTPSLATLMNTTDKQLGIDKSNKTLEKNSTRQSIVKRQSTTAAENPQNLVASAIPLEQLGLPTINPYLKTSSQSNPVEIAGASQSILDRYQNLVESNSGQMNSIIARKLLAEELNPQLATQVNNNRLINLAFIPTTGLLEEASLQDKGVAKFPKTLLVLLLLLMSCGTYYLIIALGNGSILEALREKYGKPKVPENSQDFHNRNFKQLLSLGRKVERLAGEKFSSQEFMLFLKTCQQLKKGADQYQGIDQSIQYLQVAVATQSSFLKLEQTESRYRSRKQQEFYNFVAETIDQDLDKDIFRNTLKRKLAEIVPLLNSEEGRTALQSYIKEITKISEHNLGLKLFSLFKQNNVTNFTILAKVADIVIKVQAEDLLCKDNLLVIILENYEIFENLAPIINVPQEQISPETFAIMIQYMSLVRRQGKAMEDFHHLSKALKQWHKPYKTLMTIRKQYPEDEYHLPREFSENISGLQIFKKYESYIFDD